MGQHLAKLGLATLLIGGGCSLIYNPSNLPPSADAVPDVEILIDGNASLLEIDSVAPAVIVEGAGIGGSRQAVLVIHGKHMVGENITVAITPATGQTKTPMIVIDSAKIDREGNAERLAVPVTLPIDGMLAGGETVALDITVTQDGAAPQTLTGKLTLKGLGELTMATLPAGGFVSGLHEYSQIDVAGGAIAAAAGAVEPIILRSASSVVIAPAVQISVASPGQEGGPAGGRGGNGGAILNGSGSPGTGPAAGQPSGGPGGFPSLDIQLGTLASPNRGSGGAGGNGSAVGAGGRGGGAGGTIEISGAGDVTVGAINASGAAGLAGNGIPPASSGGGGSGGVVLVRSGGALVTGAINVAGGGNGAAGRARYDAAKLATVPGDHYRGPMFADTPLITRMARQPLVVVGKPLSAFSYYFVNGESEAGEIRGPFDATISGNGQAPITPPEELHRGLNQLCVIVPGAVATSETRNCIELAYLYVP